jgi:3-methyladenine DNA glycosylase AlkD
MTSIIEQLQASRDEAYAAFQRKLLPTVDPASIIGVRTPALRGMAKQLERDGHDRAFLACLPHSYFEENQLHGFLISDISDFQECIRALERFLPCIDNWATCDQTSPKVFKKHKAELLPYIYGWLGSGHVYTVRFAIGMLMQHFLDGDFKEEYARAVAGIRSEEYYVNMEIAWYMATALAKQWQAVIPYIENRSMGKWVHNRTIQKARESRRITEEQKAYLKKFVQT